MSSIVEHFGRRREPTVPAVQRQAPPAVPHENSAKALAFVSQLHDEAQALREENGRLRADLNLALMRIRDLEQDRASTRTEMEQYRRYSVEVRAHLQTVVDVATRANEAALAAGENSEKSKQPERGTEANDAEQPAARGDQARE